MLINSCSDLRWSRSKCSRVPLINGTMRHRTAYRIIHDDVIKWKHFPRNWPFVRGIHRSPVNSPHKGQWRGALMFSLICIWINDWVNNREAGDLRRYRSQYDVIVMNTALFTGQIHKYGCALNAVLLHHENAMVIIQQFHKTLMNMCYNEIHMF